MRYNRLKPVRICCHKAAKIRDGSVISDVGLKISDLALSICLN